jgi:hypothetical protein
VIEEKIDGIQINENDKALILGFADFAWEGQKESLRTNKRA